MQGFTAHGRWQLWLRRPPLGWLVGIFTTWTVCAEENLSKIPARQGPDWLASSVIYEVFPRAFSKDGNLASVTQRLAEIKNLGADVVWLMPIHPTGEKDKPGPDGSPYAVRDFYQVDPRLGSKKDLIQLVETAHGLGLKVILDLVPNHTAWDAAAPRLEGRGGAGLPPAENTASHDRRHALLVERGEGGWVPLRCGLLCAGGFLGGGQGGLGSGPPGGFVVG